MIKVINLKKTFGDNKVLQGIDLEVEDGITTVIIGPSGCGKTVLLKHIVGLLKPDEGEVFVDSLEVSMLSKSALFGLREKMSVVFQSSALLDSLTVAENITLGLRMRKRLSSSQLNEIVKEKLLQVKLEGVEDKFPAELSGGMKKRVAIARALATNPKYILYDEPTTALDPITARQIDGLICTLQRELSITTIAVTHDLASTYKIGDKVAVLKKGKIALEGTPGEIQKCEDKEIQAFIRGRIYE